MLFWNPIKSAHMTPGLIPEVLDTTNMIMGTSNNNLLGQGQSIWTEGEPFERPTQQIFLEIPLTDINQSVSIFKGALMSICKQFGMVDTKVFKFAHIKNVVPAPAVTINNAIRDNLAFNDRV